MILFLVIAVLVFFVAWLITDNDVAAFVFSLYLSGLIYMIVPDYLPVYYEESSQEICSLSSSEEKYISTSKTSSSVTYRYLVDTEKGKLLKEFSDFDYAEVYIKEDSTQTPQIVIYYATSKNKLFSSWDNRLSARNYVVFIVPEGSVTIDDYCIH